jgi:Integrase zinc binding domain
LFATSASDGNPRALRWKLVLAAYDFTVEHKTGASNRVADELSRMHTDGHSPLPVLHEEEDMIPCLVVQFDADDLMRSPGTTLKSPLLQVPEPLEALARDELYEAQASDSWCRDMMDRIARKEQTMPKVMVIDSNGLLCSTPVQPDLPYRWVAPASLRERIRTVYHFRKVAGHPGGTRMADNVSRSWYWPNCQRTANPWFKVARVVPL